MLIYWTTKAVGAIYKQIRSDMTRDMTNEERILFLEDIPDIQSLRPQLYNHRRHFIPRRPADFVSIQIFFELSFVVCIHIIFELFFLA